MLVFNLSVGKKKFLFGDKATEFDCSLFGSSVPDTVARSRVTTETLYQRFVFQHYKPSSYIRPLRPQYSVEQ